jgi:ubiquinone/menaquinone biosynthesis C-methylase UbiE
VFTESSELYDAIYFTFKDYRSEAREIADLIRAEHPSARTVLDVACGTGGHARLLAQEHGFTVDGLDLNADFLRLARRKHPAGRFHVADMTDFHLGQQYDAVICMFSSIGYVRTLHALEQTLHCFRRHLAPGGIVVVEPWFPPEAMESGHHSTRSAEAEGVRVERDAKTRIEGRLCHLHFDYRIEEGGVTRTAAEVHELGLFTEAETLLAFEHAGLSVRHEAASADRGLYIAHHA